MRSPAPPLPTFLTARWVDLLFISFRAPATLLLPKLPRGTRLDFYEGSPIISLVAFQFLDTRLLGIRPPFFHSFAELNLRFYVRDEITDAPGVVFLKEICPYRAVAWSARLLYNERFCIAPCHFAQNDGTLSYRFPSPAREHSGEISIAAPRRDAPPSQSAISDFLVQRYDGYSQRLGSLLHYEVRHTPWSAGCATLTAFDLDVRYFYGEELGELLTQPPISVLYSAGSEIELSSAQRVMISNARSKICKTHQPELLS